ncbi:MAG: L-threonylcarbamoyladenylate synthase [Candidatus Bathyarchaeia archaeon]
MLEAKIVRVDSDNPELDVIIEAADIIRGGGLVIYPTETCYGLGANALNESAVKRVFVIKKRDLDKPISIIVADLEMWEKCAYINEAAKRLIKKFLPGPLTIVLKKRDVIPDVVSVRSIAARIPSHPIALLLVKEAGVPITATSANISDRPPLYSAQKAFATFKKDVDLILDAGRLPKRRPSMVVDLTMGASPQIIRQGPISAESVLKELKMWKDDIK